MTSTVTVLKTCVGGYVGSGGVHPALVDAAREAVAGAKDAGRVADAYVARCGDDLALVLLHGPGSSSVLSVGREAFTRSGAVSTRLGQHRARAETNGGAEVEVAEVSFDPRTSEPVLCFLSDKAPAGAWNVHLYRMFADPFNTSTLLDDERARMGFRFVVDDPASGTTEEFDLPDDLHGFLRRVTSGEGCIVREVRSRATGAAAAVASGGTDPALLVRCEDAFPTVGEVLEPLAFPYAVGAAPLMPVATTDEATTRSDGPPRAIGLGFQVTAGRLIGPRDLLGDRAFDEARRQAVSASDYLRRHGPFAPGRVAADRTTHVTTA